MNSDGIEPISGLNFSASFELFCGSFSLLFALRCWCSFYELDQFFVTILIIVDLLFFGFLFDFKRFLL